MRLRISKINPVLYVHKKMIEKRTLQAELNRYPKFLETVDRRSQFSLNTPTRMAVLKLPKEDIIAKDLLDADAMINQKGKALVASGLITAVLSIVSIMPIVTDWHHLLITPIVGGLIGVFIKIVGYALSTDMKEKFLNSLGDLVDGGKLN